jgi:hypothetical protein
VLEGDVGPGRRALIRKDGLCLGASRDPLRRRADAVSVRNCEGVASSWQLDSRLGDQWRWVRIGVGWGYRADLEALIEVRTWDASFEFAHFTDDELAQAALAQRRLGHQVTVQERAAALQQIRTPPRSST